MSSPERAFDILIGTGGLGTGTLLALEGEHTLGREESRAARLVDQQDRCKLHIITHYIARLAGIPILPIGRVGDDDAGRTVRSELEAEGMRLSFVTVERNRPTLASVCFVYPNGDGGNLTTSDSASAAVGPEDIAVTEEEFVRYGERAIALAAPEVPWAARRALLEVAGRHGALRFASFLSGEISAGFDEGSLALVDVLAINLDEAAAVAEVTDHEAQSAEEVVLAAAALLTDAFPRLRFCITAGARGSWTWDLTELRHEPPLTVQALNTAGAGDAHLAGLITGTVAGLTLPEANRVATILSAQSVLSHDTINNSITCRSLAQFAAAVGRPLSEGILAQPVGAVEA